MGKPAAAFFDLDGTLTWRDRTREYTPIELRTCGAPSEKDAEAIRKLVAAGNMAFICTGRSVCSIHPDVLALPWTGMVTLYGGYVTYRDEVLRDVPFTDEVLNDLLEGLEETKGDAVIVGTNVAVQTNGGIPNLGGWETVRTIEDVRRLYPGETFGKVFQDTVSGHKIASRKIMSEKCCFMPFLGANAPFDEFCPVENTKMLGIELIMERIKDEVGTTYGFGDSDNDLPLVRACDVGVAVGNGTDNLKAECAFVSKPLVESGCAYALEHFGLLG